MLPPEAMFCGDKDNNNINNNKNEEVTQHRRQRLSNPTTQFKKA